MLTIKNRVEQKTLVEQIAEQIAEQIGLSKSAVMVPWDGSMTLFYGVIFAQLDLLNPPFFCSTDWLSDLLNDLLTNLFLLTQICSTICSPICSLICSTDLKKDKCGFALHGLRSGN